MPTELTRRISIGEPARSRSGWPARPGAGSRRTARSSAVVGGQPVGRGRASTSVNRGLPVEVGDVLLGAGDEVVHRDDRAPRPISRSTTCDGTNPGAARRPESGCPAPKRCRDLHDAHPNAAQVAVRGNVDQVVHQPRLGSELDAVRRSPRPAGPSRTAGPGQHAPSPGRRPVQHRAEPGVPPRRPTNGPPGAGISPANASASWLSASRSGTTTNRPRRPHRRRTAPTPRPARPSTRPGSPSTTIVDDTVSPAGRPSRVERGPQRDRGRQPARGTAAPATARPPASRTDPMLWIVTLAHATPSTGPPSRHLALSRWHALHRGDLGSLSGVA